PSHPSAETLETAGAAAVFLHAELSDLGQLCQTAKGPAIRYLGHCAPMIGGSVSALWIFTEFGRIAIGHALFWLAAASLLYIYLGYPLVLAIVAAFCRRRLPEPGVYPSLSVLIAAHNEEASIARKIRETLSLDYPSDKLEILVVSDASMDRT